MIISLICYVYRENPNQTDQGPKVPGTAQTSNKEDRLCSREPAMYMSDKTQQLDERNKPDSSGLDVDVQPGQERDNGSQRA